MQQCCHMFESITLYTFTVSHTSATLLTRLVLQIILTPLVLHNYQNISTYVDIFRILSFGHFVYFCTYANNPKRSAHMSNSGCTTNFAPHKIFCICELA